MNGSPSGQTMMRAISPYHMTRRMLMTKIRQLMLEHALYGKSDKNWPKNVPHICAKGTEHIAHPHGTLWLTFVFTTEKVMPHSAVPCQLTSARWVSMAQHVKTHFYTEETSGAMPC